MKKLKTSTGDAIYETSSFYERANSWNENFSGFPDNDGSIFFIRGGCVSDSGVVGVFSFNSYYGVALGNISFRPVLSVF